MNLDSVIVDLGVWEQVLCTGYILLGLSPCVLFFLVSILGLSDSEDQKWAVPTFVGSLAVMALLVHELLNAWSMPATIYPWEKLALVPPIAVGVSLGLSFAWNSNKNIVNDVLTWGAFGGFTALFLCWILMKLWLPEQAAWVIETGKVLTPLQWGFVFLGAAVIIVCIPLGRYSATRNYQPS